MSLISFRRGQGSIILRVKILDSAATTGAGKTGLTSASSGLIISTIADNEATATAYTVAGGNVESIATLGTFAAPTSGKCRFKEVDATNHKGVYEIQIADARFAVASAKSILVSISGVTGAAETDAVVPLTDFDPYDVVRGGLTALPNTACASNASLLTSGTSTAQLSVSSGQVLVQAGTGAGQLDYTSGVIKTNVTQFLGSPLTETSGGYLAAGFKKFFDVSAPVLTTASVNQTGDAFSRIGSTGSGLTSLAPAATALSTATWTGTRAGYLDNLSGGAVALASGVVLANGVHGGSSATLTLQLANITNNSGDALTISSTGGNGHGVYISGNGGGDGMHIVGGATGHGLHLQGGSTAGDGLHAAAQTLGDGIQATGAGIGGLDINGTLSVVTTLTNHPTVTLATSQPNYAPAKAGDAMTLTTGERTAIANEVEAQIIDDTDSEKVLTAITDKIAAVNPDLGGLTVAAIAAASATSVWANGTRTLTAGTNIALTKGIGLLGLNDIAATDVVSSGAITTSGGAVSTVTTTATATNLTNLPTIPANWLTATGVKADAVTKIQDGLATTTQLSDQTTTIMTKLGTPNNGDGSLAAAIDIAIGEANAAHNIVADAGTGNIAIFQAIGDLQTYGDLHWTTATGFSTFDPVTDTVARVTLVDTCTANSDMRGTDNAAIAGDQMDLVSSPNVSGTTAIAYRTAAILADATDGEAYRTAVVTAVWSSLSSELVTAGSIGKRIVDYLTGDSFTRLGSPTGASIAADIAAVATSLTTLTTTANAINTVTEQFRFSEPNRVDSNASITGAVPTASEIADEVATRTLTAVTTVASVQGWDAEAITASITTLVDEVTLLQKFAYADQYIDITTVPWCTVFTEVGTGGPGVGTELMRKRMRDINGVNIVSTGIVPGRIFR